MQKIQLTDPSVLREILSAHGITLARTYGQHFLIDSNVLAHIVSAAFPKDVAATSAVLEIGPGAGTLTQELLEHSSNVVSIERDPRFVSLLREQFGEQKHLHIVEGDALRESFSSLVDRQKISGRYAVVSNLPYEITTPFLWKILFEEEKRPQRIVLLLQADVISRIFETGSKRSLLGLLVQLAGKARQVKTVSKQAFFPPPNVTSAVLLIENIPEKVSDADRKIIAAAKNAFASPRKKLSSTIGDIAGTFKDRRPGELAVEEWRRMIS